MRSRGVRVLGVFAAVVLLGGFAIWGLAFRIPAADRLPLPDGLIREESPAGREMLAESYFLADYSRLTQSFEAQSRPAFCGVASAVVVINALRSSGPRLTQSTFFTESASAVRGPLRVTFAGMSLAQLAELLRAHGLAAMVFYASDTDLNAFRTIAQQNLSTSGDFLLVNYQRGRLGQRQRASLGQSEMGHISPIAAYNAKADQLLILDVAAYKYPPVWVSTDVLWNAMNTIDDASGRTRGFIVVR